MKQIKVFKDRKELMELRQKNILETKKAIRESTGKDDLIIQTINSIDDIQVVANKLSGRLRLWYELYNPEYSKSVPDNQKFVELILITDKEKALKELGIKSSESMGADFGDDDVEVMMELASEIKSLYKIIESFKKYIDKEMLKLCPNITALTGGIIGAKLLEHAGSIKKMMKMPSSTIQLLGAEKALFRHLKTGARCPKYGLILQHPIVANAKDKAKAARVFADKISLASKIDYFKGDFIGDKLKKQVEAKIK